MCLTKKTDPVVRMIYAFGGGAQYYPGWADATKPEQDEWRVLIVAVTDTVRSDWRATRAVLCASLEPMPG
jgi:hypothetical protein